MCWYRVYLYTCSENETAFHHHPSSWILMSRQDYPVWQCVSVRYFFASMPVIDFIVTLLFQAFICICFTLRRWSLQSVPLGRRAPCPNGKHGKQWSCEYADKQNRLHCSKTSKHYSKKYNLACLLQWLCLVLLEIWWLQCSLRTRPCLPGMSRCLHLHLPSSTTSELRCYLNKTPVLSDV